VIKKAFILLIIAQLFFLQLSYAQDHNALRKLARGAVNTTLSAFEVPRQMMKVKECDGDIAGLFWGSLKGMACFLGRSAVGVYELGTFLIPTYKPLVEPEFIFSQEYDEEACEQEQ